MSDLDQYLFVYGTLRSNRENSHVLTGTGALLLGAASTDTGYVLIDDGLPFIFRTPAGCGRQIKGEVWLVSMRALAGDLDLFEGAHGGPGALYRRKRITATFSETGETVRCWCYIGTDCSLISRDIGLISYSETAESP